MGSDYLVAFNQVADVVLIDGKDDFNFKEPWREICFRHAEPMMRPGSIIVLDDSWAYPRVRADNRSKARRVYSGVGPARAGPATTDIFFY